MHSVALFKQSLGAMLKIIREEADHRFGISPGESSVALALGNNRSVCPWHHELSAWDPQDSRGSESF